MPTKLEGKSVLVTGGGSGIGEGAAKALAKEGCQVVICGRREPMLRSVASSVDARFPMRYRVCDVSDREAVRGLCDWLASEKADPDIVVNAAGTNVPKRSMADVDPEEFDRVMAINTTGIPKKLALCWISCAPGTRPVSTTSGFCPARWDW